ncbi:hypothetical protein PIB30_062918 [Stylosanthes scabra]|uniref:Glycosyltransferase n=1 Tax=Stylosanthes scabra TaxID=79078 RepID=A0ABU6TL11_9FABA|nr:hypothetical protein [Stylosanthes scabra]
MGSEYHHGLHIFLFPFMAHGHVIPTIDMAKLFASRGVKSTIITTPLNVPFISKAIAKSKTPYTDDDIHIQTIKLPLVEAGLPEGCENMDSFTSAHADLVPNFFRATRLLQEQFEEQLLQHYPDCVVADHFFPWVTDSASKFGIPTLVFHGISFFSLCAEKCMELYQPHKNVSSDSEPFVIPEETDITRFFKEVRESEEKCYGVLVNSVYELEKDYADYYRNVLGRKAWHIGPLSLCNKDAEEKTFRGKDATIDGNECLKWLDTKKPNSVVYVCFGSIANFSDSQLKDIATGLEASGHEFIWVVRKSKEDGDEWLPEGFEKRMEGKGVIIRGWAPQVLILEHQAIGAFVTHCGWNSTLEAVAAGVPMITWPIAAEQFYNEKLVSEVLGIGVGVGAKKWSHFVGGEIEWEAVEKAVRKIMEGEEAEEMRNKAKVLSKLVKGAVEEGGSSYTDLDALIQDLSSLRR